MAAYSFAPRIGLAEFYNAVFERRGFTLGAHHYPVCQGLEDQRIDNLLFLGAQGTGKSVLISELFPVWVLGHDPTMAVLSVSAGERLPQTFMQAAMQIIMRDPTFHGLFPSVRPAPGLGWSLDRGLFVTGHHDADENPSYFSCGLASKALTGLHARLMVLDDIHDEENSRTPEARAEVVSRYYRTLVGRADARGCRRVAAGRWWARDDLYQELILSGDWVVMSLPAERPNHRGALYYDVYVPKGLDCVFTEVGVRDAERTGIDGPGFGGDGARLYDKFRVHYAAADPTGQGFYWPAMPAKRKDYLAVKRRRPRVASLNWNGDLDAAGEEVFRPDDFTPYAVPFDVSKLALGRRDPEVEAWVRSTRGYVESAWDTAFGQPRSAALTSSVVGLFVPCQSWHRGEDSAVLGPCDFHYDVYLLDVYAEDLDFRELAMALRSRSALWGPRRITVEEKASGISLLQTFRGLGLPVRGQRVSEGKVERAVDAVFSGDGVGGGGASVQGWCRMGRVLYPAGAKWALPDPARPEERPGWLARMLSFRGGTKNADEFDATVHLVTRAILCSVRTGKLGIDPAGVPGARDSSDPRLQSSALLSAVGDLARRSAPAVAVEESPFRGFCGAGCWAYGIVDNSEACVHPAHPRRTTAFDGCHDWGAKPPSDVEVPEAGIVRIG